MNDFFGGIYGETMFGEFAVAILITGYPVVGSFKELSLSTGDVGSLTINYGESDTVSLSIGEYADISINPGDSRVI